MTDKTIGYAPCPECDNASAEIRKDKKGNPYRHCAECGAAYFTHGGARGEAMLSRMRPKQQPEPGTPEPSPVDGVEPVVPEHLPKKKSFLEELLS